jgi:tRNA-Thr(GGU) m(6)t(6)A37 methyltransferase TsaA
MDIIKYSPIGIIHSPFRESRGTPIQSKSGMGTQATAEIFPEYAEGLKDLDGFSHIYLLFHFHLSKKPELLQKPFMDDEKMGVFAIRSPSRPNPIGLSIVRLIGIEGNIITFEGVDVLDGTPLLDIKPYVPDFDAFEADRKGWLKANVLKLRKTRDNGRFSKDS